MVVDEVRYSRKEKEEKRQSSQCVKVHLLGLGNAYEPLLFDYTDFVITARSAAPIENSYLLRRQLQAH